MGLEGTPPIGNHPQGYGFGPTPSVTTTCVLCSCSVYVQKPRGRGDPGNLRPGWCGDRMVGGRTKRCKTYYRENYFQSSRRETRNISFSRN